MKKKQKTYKSIEYMVASGYCRTSNKFGLVSRIDRPDWREHMAERAYPPEYGYTHLGHAWVKNLGTRAADQYRRCYSQDKFEMGRSTGRRFPPSEGGGVNEFLEDKCE